MTTRSRLLRGPRIAAALGAALLAIASAAHATTPPHDAGTYRVYQKDRLLGTEEFWIARMSDSLVVRAHASELLPRPGAPPDTLDKYGELLLGADDHSLLRYVSQERLNDQQLRRELAMEDTIYSSSRLRGLGGYTDVFVRPPGRIYVIDPQLFTLFDVLLRDVGPQGLDERGVTMLYLAGRDTSAEAKVKRLGPDPVTIGTRRYEAQKFSITDAWSEFYAWISPTGQMLKLTLPLVGLRVERDAKTLTRKGAPLLTGNEFVREPPVQVLR